MTFYYQWFLNDTLNSSGQTSLNYTVGTEINVANISNTLTTTGDNWILSCLAQDIVTGTNSTWNNYTVTIISNPPGFSDYSDDSSATYPEIGNVFHMNVNDSLKYPKCLYSSFSML